MKRLVALIALFVTAGAFAQNADIGLTKTLGPGSSFFTVTITNYGPQTAPGPFVVNDTLPAPASLFGPPIQPPWNCTPPFPATNVNCTFAGGLAPGQSAVLRLRYNQGASTTDFLNCARVSTTTSVDPNPDNNRDCACVDVSRCRDVVIDLTSGRENGVNLNPNAQDLEWIHVPASGTPTAAYVGTYQGWLAPTTGGWINPVAAPSGTVVEPNPNPSTYRYRFNFTLASTWAAHQCSININFAGDNSVTFSLDNNPSFAPAPGQPPATFKTLSWDP